MNTLMMDGGNEDVNEPLKITHLKTLIDTTKPGTYWILGEISSLENTPDWCYLGCTECNKKVIPDGSHFTCSGCDLRMPHGVYKLDQTTQVSSQGEATSRRKMDAIDGNDPVKRQLLDELSITSCKKKEWTEKKDFVAGCELKREKEDLRWRSGRRRRTEMKDLGEGRPSQMPEKKDREMNVLPRIISSADEVSLFRYGYVHLNVVRLRQRWVGQDCGGRSNHSVCTVHFQSPPTHAPLFPFSGPTAETPKESFG
ncbi:hypothetical protein DM860_014913 [Cuscuta australis]|uniref:Replication factor A C-terminal domain-containing protein n=1 Tax=Cuscuta australis TaxID=267555 RepID=A0A328E3T8_9ASTE|nr:hypothetical protein DM860_014913 [Cuscuta australis]